jgi:restriction system protein
MRRQKESLGEMLLKAPWWVSAALGVLVFIGLRWGLPAWADDNKTLQSLISTFVSLAPVILLLFGLLSVASFWFGLRRRQLLEVQTSLETIRNTSWKEFEFLVAEAYRRQGYQVDFSLARGADGGVDLVLRRGGQTTLVQCKQWQVYSVGAPVVREMFGLMTAERADAVIVVTSGKFTRDAQAFAAGKPIQLVDGPQLLALIQSVQAESTAAPVGEAEPPTTNTPSCPLCRKPMVIRTARRGTNAGSQFWGCSGYPACKGTRAA